MEVVLSESFFPVILAVFLAYNVPTWAWKAIEGRGDDGIAPNGEHLKGEWIYKLVLISLSAAVSSLYINASGSFTFWKMYSLQVEIIYSLCVFNIP